MMPLYKILFMITLATGTLISISSNSWLGVWMGLEMNLLSFIPLMNDSSNPRSTEASLKYFIVQALASIILLMGMLTDTINSDLPSNLLTSNLPFLCITTALVIKTGAAPTHFWFPEVMEGLSWLNATLLLTWQKIAPMITLTYTSMNENFLTFLIIMSVIVGGLMGLSQTSMRKILSYSSINHIGWMLAALFFTETLWTWYFSIYSMMNSVITWALSKFNISSVSQMMVMSKLYPQLKIFLMFNLFSLGGIPPFIGFLPKWLTVQTMISKEMYFTTCLMIVITLVTLYFYMRIAMPSLSLTTSNKSLIYSKIYSKSKKMLILNSALLMSLAASTLTFNWI
uniref:NADH dehydrogenase subunit 2 n=1 Tax=Agrilus adelphinus TaxID=2201944 RepID=UPI0023AAD1C5|nr:NADH dehydrogenase subunit 2 [Agrilus adelphinus]WCO09264.1 NADH dehydrogenase subunit 2 [Agrilus adelphinus]